MGQLFDALCTPEPPSAPLTPALSPSEGERGNCLQVFGDSSFMGEGALPSVAGRGPGWGNRTHAVSTVSGILRLVAGPKFNTDNRRGMRFIPRAFMPKRTDIHSVLIIGAGPIIIGQASRLPHSAESGLHTHSLVRSSTRARPVSTALMRLTCRSIAPSSSR